MSGLEAAASVIAVIDMSAKVASLCFQYFKAVKDAKDDIERVQRKTTDLTHILEKLEQLLNGKDKTRVSITRSLQDSLKQCLLELEKLDLKLDTKESSKNLDPKGPRKVMRKFGLRALKWPFTSKEVDKTISALEGYEHTFVLALQLDQTGLIMGIDQKLDLTKLPVATGASFNSHKEEHNARCLPNTRVQLLNEIAAWASDKESKPIFWLRGMAGTGKSTIARTIAQSFFDHNQLGASFFFKKGEGECGNASRFFTTIASQLLKYEPGMVHGVAKALAEDPDIWQRNLKDQFEKLVLQPLLDIEPSRSLSSVRVIVIDALDECEQEKHIQEILRLLAQTKAIQSVLLRIVVTSRPELHIQSNFTKLDGTYQDLVLHEVPRSTIESDIRVFLEHELGIIQKERMLSANWPNNDQVTALVERATPLFIYAATVSRYIGNKGGDPEEYLNKILLNNKSSFSQLDRIYFLILEQLLLDQEEEDKALWLETFREVVGSIVVLESPLCTMPLARLLQISPTRVRLRLEALHSILSVPSEDNIPVRLLHLSFREFLVDPEKQGKSPFWVDEKTTHMRLAHRCLELMSEPNGLRKNICKLSGPSVARREIGEERIASNMSSELQYACRYWVDHLKQSEQSIVDMDATYLFLKNHFLHWLEAMALMGGISDSIVLIETLLRLSQNDEATDTQKFLVDAKRFVLTNRSIIDDIPLQLYLTSLILAPTRSVIKSAFESCIPDWILRYPTAQSDWGAQIQTLEGHSSMVSSVAHSLDGNYLASASADCTVRLWDAMTGRPLSILEGHRAWVRSVTFSPNSKQLASASDDHEIHLWDVNTGLLLKALTGHSGSVSSVAFSPGGTMLASGSEDNSIRLWDVDAGQLIQSLLGHESPVRSVAFSPDDRHMASASDDGNILLWDAANAQLLKTLEGHNKKVFSVAFSPDGLTLASGSKDNRIRLWDVATGQVIKILRGHKDSVRSVAFSRDQSLLVSSSDDWAIRTWEVATWQPLHMFLGHLFKVSAVAFSPDGGRLVSSSADCTIRLWDQSIAQRQLFDEHRQLVTSIAVSPNGMQLASSSFDHTIRLWDIATGQSTKTLLGHKSMVDTVTFSPDGKQLASGSANGNVGVWNAATGQLLWMRRGHRQAVPIITFSLGGSQLASTSHDKTTRLWDVATGKESRILVDATQTVTSISFSPHGQQVATVSADNVMQLWETATGRLLRTLKDQTHKMDFASFLPDDKHLISVSSDNTICMWDVATGQQLRTFKGYGRPVKLESAGDQASLITRKGTLRLNASNFGDLDSIPEFAEHPVRLNKEWISINGDNVIWLPDQHRGSCSVLSGNRLIIGQRSGQIHFWEFDAARARRVAEIGDE